MLPKAAVVSVECDIAKGLHAFTIVGLPDKSVEEAKDRLAAAIRNTGELESPKKSNKKIVLSLAPAALKKEGAVFDMPLALAFLLASEQAAFALSGQGVCRRTRARRLGARYSRCSFDCLRRTRCRLH